MKINISLMVLLFCSCHLHTKRRLFNSYISRNITQYLHKDYCLFAMPNIQANYMTVTMTLI